MTTLQHIALQLFTKLISIQIKKECERKKMSELFRLHFFSVVVIWLWHAVVIQLKQIISVGNLYVKIETTVQPE